MKNLTGTNNSFSRVSRYLWTILAIGLILFLGKTLFVPAFFGLLIAVVMYPICRWMETHGWPRSIAIAFVIAFVTLLFFAFIWLLTIEVNIFVRDIPLITQELKSKLPALQQWLQQKIGLSIVDQERWINNINIKIQSEIIGTIQSAIGATIGSLFMLLLIPIYTALLLFHRETVVKYLELITGAKHEKKLHVILKEITSTYFHFIKGTFFVYIIVGTLNSIGLYAIGIENALLYGMLTAFMTIIPYVGIIISALLPISAALITKSSIWYPIGVVLIFSFVQYLEANIIFPRVVGVQLNVSTLATMVSIIVGTILWGIAGMILFIPFVAILKIVSDHIDEWKPLNILLSRTPI